MRINQVIFLFLDVSVRTGGVVLAIINLLGYVWFASTLPFALVIPPFVILAVILVPLKILASQRWLLVMLATIYIASYAFGGLNFALANDQLVKYVLPEVIIVVYFSFRAMYLKQDSGSSDGSTGANSIETKK